MARRASLALLLAGLLSTLVPARGERFGDLGGLEGGAGGVTRVRAQLGTRMGTRARRDPREGLGDVLLEAGLGGQRGPPGPPPRRAGRALPAGSQRPREAAARPSNFFPGRVWTYSRGEMQRVFSKSQTPIAGGTRASRGPWVPARGRLLRCPQPACAPLQRPGSPPGAPRGAPVFVVARGATPCVPGPKFGLGCAACEAAERGWG